MKGKVPPKQEDNSLLVVVALIASIIGFILWVLGLSEEGNPRKIRGGRRGR